MHKSTKFSIITALLLLTLILNRLNAQIPDWTKTDSNGNLYTLHSILKSDKAVLLDFFATWCGPCASSMPSLQEIWEDCGKGSGKFYLFGLDEDLAETNADINNFKSTYAADFPSFAQCSTDFYYYNNLYGSNGIPLFILIIPDTSNPGNSPVVYSQVGWSSSVETKIRNTLDIYGYGCVITGEENLFLQTKNGFSAYPNPVSDYFILRFGNSSSFHAEIFNLMGQRMLYSEEKQNANQEVRIDVSAFPEGVYLAKIFQKETGLITAIKLNVVR